MHSSRTPGCLKAIAQRLLCLVPLLLPATGTQAHPHGWIDYRVTLIFNEREQLVALQQYWKMDPFQSLALIEGLARAEGDETEEERLAALGREIAHNLSTNGYLTHLYHGDRPQAFSGIVDHTTRVDRRRVEFAFVLALDEPLSVEKPVRWQIYDATYYIEFLHDDRVETPIALAEAPAGCDVAIEQADPDPEKIAAAQALDADETAPEGLGRYFTETGVMTCPAL